MIFSKGVPGYVLRNVVVALLRCTNLNASRPSEHPTQYYYRVVLYGLHIHIAEYGSTG